MEKICWQNHCGSLHAATPCTIDEIQLQKTIVLPMQPQHEATLTQPFTLRETILQLQSTMEFHRQLIHQHHLQSHLQWGNDPRVANHNGIPSATHPPAPLAIPFTLRERSYSCKSQWNSVDHKCTKHRWHPIYNAETDPRMIREWSENIRPWSDPHTRPSRTRRTAEVDHRTFGDGLCMEKTQGFVHLLSLKNAFRARLPPKLHRQLLHQHHLQCHLQWGNNFFANSFCD